jgi:DNA helicase II / ATP-dependent DNA helicase PcrA
VVGYTEKVSSLSAEYDRLNVAQKRAVDSIEGPVMVVAGPGTGKTQVLSLRVAKILEKTQAKPSNILCLTFSRSGATAMRERLRSLIGADAYGVTVSTIHGFCGEIIQQYPIVFEEWSALEQISDIERYRQINRIIDQMMPDCVLVSRKNPYQRTRDILSRISDIKREGKQDPAFLRSVVESYGALMEAKSKKGTKAHQQNILRARKFSEFVDVFIRYQDMLGRTNRYDYDDMILRVIEALKGNDWLLSGLQERYQYILVDEFQDTNGAQYELIELLTKPRTAEDDPNLFVVGDDDQAIYRFQGANLTNILKFYHRFPKSDIVVLTISYRCSQEILDASGSLISKNTERLVTSMKGLEKNLQSSSKKKSAQPILLHAPTNETEPWVIADLIEDKIREGVKASEIAILVQTNAELRPIYDILRSRQIDAQMTGSLDLLMHPLVMQIIAIFRAAIDPRKNDVLASAIASECFDCHPADLGRLFSLRERGASLLDLLLQFGVPGAKDQIRLHDETSLFRARDLILDLHQGLNTRTIIETLELLIKHSGILPKKNEKDSHLDPIDLAVVQEFFDRVKYRAYEQRAFTAQSLEDDIDHHLNPDYGDLRMTYEFPHLSEKGVSLMTAHRSKGLEFDFVILPNFRERHWDHRRKPLSLSMPEDLLFGWSGEQKKYESEQDERRVAFVAMTRARKELIFTCPRLRNDGNRSSAVSPSAFFAESGKLPEADGTLHDPAGSMLLLRPVLRDIDEEYKTFLRKRIQEFSLSVTALNHFLEDPKLFEASDLLQMPQSKDANLVYGNAVHDALRRWALSIQERSPMTSDQFLSAFLQYLDEREVLTTQERGRLSMEGKENLPRYFTERLEGFEPMIIGVEQSLSTRLGDIPIKGKIDRIDQVSPASSEVRIIDYKTGRPRTESEIREDATYFRQLVFYALLLQHGKPFWKPQSFTLDFIGQGSDSPIERTLVITEKDQHDLMTLIRAVWSKILALDFTPIDLKNI